MWIFYYWPIFESVLFFLLRLQEPAEPPLRRPLHYNCLVSDLPILLLIADGSMLRTCAPIGVDDCETANGVTYCYCKNELCNNPSKKLSNPNPGSGLLSSPQKSDLLIDTNRQNIEGKTVWNPLFIFQGHFVLCCSFTFFLHSNWKFQVIANLNFIS